IKPYGNLWLEILASRTGIKKINLAYRWVQIMNGIGDTHKLSAAYEKKMRSYVHEIHLDYPYPRPRVLAARQALGVLLGELIDANILTNADLFKYFPVHDFGIDVFIEENLKPSFVPNLKVGGYRSLSEEWVKDVEKSSRLTEELIEYEKDWYVVGEYSCVKSLEWGT